MFGVQVGKRTKKEASRFVANFECAKVEVGECVDGLHYRLPRTTKGYLLCFRLLSMGSRNQHILIIGESIYTVRKWAQLYLTKIVRLHGVPILIVSNRDACFTLKF